MAFTPLALRASVINLRPISMPHNSMHISFHNIQHSPRINKPLKLKPDPRKMHPGTNTANKKNQCSGQTSLTRPLTPSKILFKPDARAYLDALRIIQILVTIAFNNEQEKKPATVIVRPRYPFPYADRGKKNDICYPQTQWLNEKMTWVTHLNFSIAFTI